MISFSQVDFEEVESHCVWVTTYCLVMWANIFWENKGENWNKIIYFFYENIIAWINLALNISRQWKVL